MTRQRTKSRIGRLRPIGQVSSPLQTIADCPRQPDEAAPPAILLIETEVAPALTGLEPGDHILVLTWLHVADRTALTNHPRGDSTRKPKGVFATRSEDRPNPVGVHHTVVTGIEGNRVMVSELETLDGTPILDIKPNLGPIPDR